MAPGLHNPAQHRGYCHQKALTGGTVAPRLQLPAGFPSRPSALRFQPAFRVSGSFSAWRRWKRYLHGLSLFLDAQNKPERSADALTSPKRLRQRAFGPAPPAFCTAIARTVLDLIFASLAGLLTLINPCVLPVLPVLPIVMASSLHRDRCAPVALAAGLSLSFVALGRGVSGLGPALGFNADSVAVGGCGDAGRKPWIASHAATHRLSQTSATRWPSRQSLARSSALGTSPFSVKSIRGRPVAGFICRFGAVISLAEVVTRGSIRAGSGPSAGCSPKSTTKRRPSSNTRAQPAVSITGATAPSAGAVAQQCRWKAKACSCPAASGVSGRQK